MATTVKDIILMGTDMCFPLFIQKSFVMHNNIESVCGWCTSPSVRRKE